MAKQITKAALQAQLAEANAAYERIEGLYAAALIENEALRAQQAAHSTPSRRVAAAMPAWQAQRAEVMARAKAMAVATGHTVRVG